MFEPHPHNIYFLLLSPCVSHKEANYDYLPEGFCVSPSTDMRLHMRDVKKHDIPFRKISFLTYSRTRRMIDLGESQILTCSVF